MTRAWLGGIALFLGACVGDVGGKESGDSDSACHDDGDCEGGQTCFSEDDPRCGECEIAEFACTTSEDCEGGLVCASYRVSCPCDGDQGTRCADPCTADSCAEGEQCDTVSGLCELQRCDVDYTCPTWFHCDAAASGTGCVRDTCTTDSDCAASGWCVEGTCFESLGFCSYEPP